MNQSNTGLSYSSPKDLYKIGGVVALMCAVKHFVALAIYIPAYCLSPRPATASEWFAPLQASPLTGLFFLGLANLVIAILWIPKARRKPRSEEYHCACYEKSKPREL